MTNEIIKTDKILTQRQSQTLNALLDAIIPASSDGLMPAASKIEFEKYVAEIEAEFVTILCQGLDSLDEHSSSAKGFASLDADAQQAVIAQSTIGSTKTTNGLQNLSEFYSLLTPIVFACYYQNKKALEGLGLESRAPFPKGNEVDLGDLSLLDPVRSRGTMWRQLD